MKNYVARYCVGRVAIGSAMHFAHHAHVNTYRFCIEQGRKLVGSDQSNRINKSYNMNMAEKSRMLLRENDIKGIEREEGGKRGGRYRAR